MKGANNMNHKFTADGRKVAVVGQLNSAETIVQEIFVVDGSEVPAGELFVVKTLLDAPAETSKVREEKKLLENIKRLEQERDKIQKEVDGFRLASQAAMAKIKWIQGIKDPEVTKTVDHVRAILCGEYTHIVFNDCDGMKIEEWNAELFSLTNDYGRFDGIGLVSLFGNWGDGRLELDWRVNAYSDGSGGRSKSFLPCRSLGEAIDRAKKIIYAKASLSDRDFEFCMKYSIPVEEVKNLARLTSKANAFKTKIARCEAEINTAKEGLAAIEKAMEV